MLRDNWLKWFERRIQLGRNTTRRRRAGKRLQVHTAWVAQALEDRTLLATFTVDTLVDESDGNFGAGDLSLREAIQQANATTAADTVQFVNGLGGGVINLTLGPLAVTENLTINGFANAISLTGSGIVLQESGPGNVLTFAMTGVGVNGTTSGPGLLIESTNDGRVNATFTNSFFHNSAVAGIRINDHTGGESRLTLSNVAVNSNGDVTLSPGISVGVGVTAPALSPNTAGKFATTRLNLTNVQIRNNALEGLDVTAMTGGRFDMPTTALNTTFTGNGFASTRNQVDMIASGIGSSIVSRFDTVTANSAAASAFNYVSTAGASVAAVIRNATANNAGADAFALRAEGAGSTAAVTIENFVGDDAGSSGAEFNINSGAVVNVNTFNNVSMQNAGWSAIDVNLIGGTLNTFNGSAVNASGSQLNGLDLALRSGTANVTITGLTANNNVERGVQVTAIVGGVYNVTLNNVAVQGNQKQPLNAVVITNSTLNLAVNGGSMTSAGGDPNTSVFAHIENNATGNLTFSNLSVLDSNGAALSARYDRNAKGNLQITNTTATNAQSVGLALFVLGGSQVTSNVTGLNVSGAGAGISADGVRVEVVGPVSKADLAFSGLTANGASARGISLVYANGATGAVTQFNNVSAQNARQDGLFIDIRGTSKLTSFNANGVNVTGAGTSGNTAHDGFDLNVQGSGATGTFNIQNLTASGARGRGVNLNIQNKGVAQVVVNGFTADSNGLEGLNLAVGTGFPGGVLQNSAFRNGTFSGNGMAAMSDGIRTRVAGTGSLANVILDNVDAGLNSRSGHDALVSAGGNLTLQVDNASTANSNFLNGLRFVATGATTRAALTSLIGGNAFNDNNDDGLFVQFLAGVKVSDLTIRGGASANRENGAVIDIDDGSGVTVNNFLIAGASSNFSNNDLTGLVVRMDDVLGLASFSVDGVTASGNLGGATGINILLTDMTVANVSATNFSTQNNNGDGLTLLLDDVTVTNNLTVTGFNSGGNSGDGVEVSLVNTTTVGAAMSVNGTAAGNTGDGAKVIANDGSGVSVGSFAISGGALSVNGNTGNGLTVDFNNVAGITAFDLSGMVITNNQGDQVFARFRNMPAPIAMSFNDAVATGPGAGSGVGDGIDLTLDNTTASSLNLNRINASDNGGDGLKLNLLNGASIPATSVDVGTFDDNGANGIGINITNSTASIDITNSTFDLLDTVASASGNGNDGVRIRLDNATLTMNTIDHITFDDNGRIGFNVEGATPSTFTSSGSFTNNTVTNNGSFGWRGVFNGGDFDISIGSTTAGNGNLFDNNTGAGISLDMIQDSTGHMVILDNTITNTQNDGIGATPFAGEGIFVRMLGTANPAQATNTLTDGGSGPGLLIRDNRIGVDATDTAAGNDGHGITFQAEEQSVLDGLHIHDNRVENNGAGEPTIPRDGLNFRRLDEVDVIDFQILRNTFNDSADDGIELLGQNDDNSVMEVEVGDNDVMRNGNDGVALQVNAEAGLDIDMHDNTIVQNVDDGLQTTEVILDISDARRVLGTVDDNVIAENGNRGVNISGVTSGLAFSDNTIGMLVDQFDQPVFLGNGRTGVELNGAGSTIWDRNDVRANGRLAGADRTVGHGFDIQGAGSKSVLMRDNQIRENFRDGIEFLNNTDGRFSFTLTMVDNRVQDNAGRGLDILNRATSGGSFGDAQSFITIHRDTTDPSSTGNVFNSNGEEGIYAVNTPSTTQNQTDFSGTPLATDGAPARIPDIDLNLSLVIDHATISNNGDPANVGNMLASAGLFVRVGSAGLSNLFSNSDFATANFTTGAGDISGPVTPSFVNTGVFLQLTSSTLLGNFGDDVFLHGYTATAAPPAVAGTWNDTMFQITGNTARNGDPLARLDAVWGTDTNGNANTYQSLDINNNLRRGAGGEAGAFYSNADGTFKSRLLVIPTPMNDQDGPFIEAGRRRNAQRTGARVYPGGSTLAPSPSTAPGSGSFHYPGMGDSTFRLSTGGDTSIADDLFFSEGFTLDDPFGDYSPIESPSEANGVAFTPGPPANGELPFGWGTY